MLEINFPIMIAQVVTFLIALFVLWKAAWGPLVRFMEQRRRSIESDLEDAKRSIEEAGRLEQQYKARLSDIDREVKSRLEKAVAEGHKRREEILDEAASDAKRLMENVRGEILVEKQQAIKELRKESVTLAVLIAEKVLKQSVDRKVHERLVEEFIKELKDEQ